MRDAATAPPRLRRFEIVQTLGSGGMGIVYEAIDRERGGRVALKTLPTLDAALRLRFKREFRAIQDIHHPNLVTLGELFEEDGQLWFTMELVTCDHFLEYVRPRHERGAPPDAPAGGPASGVLDEARLRSALAQLGAGLDALHRAGRVHRDVKPSNILVTAAGRVVILDFGLVADIARPDPAGPVVGTAHFMAPEQAAGLPAGPEADWYSVGVLLAGLPEAEAEALLPPDAAALVLVFPDLLAPRGAAARPGAVGPLELRARAFAALHALLGRLAARRPLVLVIDDVQWADADSIALLGELVRPPGVPGLLVAVTRRTASEPSAARSSELSALLSQARRIPLQGLPIEEAQALVGVLLPDATLLSDVDAAEIAGEARGHPLFIDALVRHRLVQTDSARPVRLDDALWARVQQLEEAPRRLLSAIAVAGTPIPVEIAAQAAATAPDALAGALVVLQAARLARLRGAGREPRVETYHDRVRETVIRHLHAAERSAWRGRLARALEASGGAELETLAIHWREAGDGVSASGYAARAGAEAAGALAFDRAAHLYRMALALGADAREPAAERAMRVRLGAALHDAGRGAEAGQIFLLAAEGAPPAEALELRRRSAEDFLRAGYVDEGTAVLRRVLATQRLELPETPARAVAMLLVERAKLRLRGLHHEERREREVDPALLAKIDICRGVADGLALVDIPCCTAFQTLTLRLALSAGEPIRLARSLADEATVRAAAGGRSSARCAELLGRAEALARRSGDPLTLAHVQVNVGITAFCGGSFRESLVQLDRADTLLRERCAGIPWERGLVAHFGLMALWLVGDLRELGRRAPVSLREAEERGDRYVATSLRSGIINGRWLVADRPEQALDEAEEAIRGWSGTGFSLQHFFDLLAIAHHGLYVGDGPRAYRYLTGAGVLVARAD